MLRVHCCLWCGDALPDGVRMDAKYCSGSCRTMACRQRQRLGIPPFPIGKPLRTPLYDVEEQRPPGAAVQGDLDLNDRVTALSALLNAARSRNAELEALVAQLAMRESEAKVQNSVLLKELSAEQANNRELMHRFQERPGTAQAVDNGIPHQMAPATNLASGPRPVTTQSSAVRSSKPGESVSTTQSMCPPIDPEKAERIHRAAQEVIDGVRYRLAEKRGKAQEFRVAAFDSMSNRLRQASEAILIEIVRGQNPAGLEGAQRQWALNKIRDVLRREEPKLLSVLEMKGVQAFRNLLPEVAERTLDARRYFRTT